MVEKLRDSQIELIQKLAFGHHLKGHRDIEGQKRFRLYESDKIEPIGSPSQADVEALRELGLLDSNMKFPAARFFLSPAGQQLATTLHTE